MTIELSSFRVGRLQTMVMRNKWSIVGLRVDLGQFGGVELLAYPHLRVTCQHQNLFHQSSINPSTRARSVMPFAASQPRSMTMYQFAEEKDCILVESHHWHRELMGPWGVSRRLPTPYWTPQCNAQQCLAEQQKDCSSLQAYLRHFCKTESQKNISG